MKSMSRLKIPPRCGVKGLGLRPAFGPTIWSVPVLVDHQREEQTGDRAERESQSGGSHRLLPDFLRQLTCGELGTSSEWTN